MKQKLTKEQMAYRAALEFKDGDFVNLGAGIPTQCARFSFNDKEIMFHSENGVANYGELVTLENWEEAKIEFTDAAGTYYLPKPGMVFFDYNTSLDLMRNGRLDYTCLGAFQVSAGGDLANWQKPGVKDMGVGGAMDLIFGAKQVIAIMEHVSTRGDLKILKECTFPLTGKACWDLLISDIAVIERTDTGLILLECAEGWTPEAVQKLTEPELIIADDLRTIPV
jgi:3-oxoacid CoA-transferase B subunit